jgi:undecaprenyl-diphosphatase
VSAGLAALLGVVQGLTEFLPISSSAHLIIARDLFGVHLSPPLDLAFDVACHVGTLVAVLVFFRSEVVGMLLAVSRAWRPSPGLAARRIQLIVAGTVPIVVVGGLGGASLEETLRTPVVAASMLAIGGVLLLVAERAASQARPESALTVRHAVIVGIAQSAALVPGVSRAGATIAAGLLLGYRRADIARFTFLLSIPAILAAAAKNALELGGVALSPQDRQAFAIAMVTSGIVGYVTIKFLLRYLANHRLDVFAWYRFALAGVLLLVFLRR